MQIKVGDWITWGVKTSAHKVVKIEEGSYHLQEMITLKNGEHRLEVDTAVGRYEDNIIIVNDHIYVKRLNTPLWKVLNG